MKSPYHTALSHGRTEGATPLHGSYHDGRRNHVYVWGLKGSIPDPYRACDLIYGEPAWPAGLKEFDKRAGVTTESYAAHIADVARVMQSLNKPTVLVGSPAMLLKLPGLDLSGEILLNTAKATMGFYNGASPVFMPTTDALLHALALIYTRVGDFCCGYGNTGKIFLEAGRNCVLSDYNAECCGYVAAHLGKWGPA